jgi:hypothetical protein
MRTGKIQIQNCRLGSSTLRRIYPPATLAFPSDTKILWPTWRWAQVFCSALFCRCSLRRLCRPGTKTGVTLLPIRDFHIWGNLPHRPPMLLPSYLTAVGPATRAMPSAFAKLRSTTNCAKIIHMLIVPGLLWSMDTSHTRMFDLALYTSFCH